MADLVDHINQAKHNAACAAHLLGGKTYRDWAITATFYAAVHFAEAAFNSLPDVRHSETQGISPDSPHDVREKLIRDKFGEACWKSYKKLRQASNNVRYLASWRSMRTGTALDYYQPADAEKFLSEDLTRVKSEIQKVVKVKLD